MPRSILRLLLLGSFCLGVARLARADLIQFRSEPTQTPLLELYTSEGCSSCPPADEWMSRLKDNPKLWKAFVPVAFHVDYWDYLGWKDPFAQADFSERQRDYATHWRSRSVYTPGFVWEGREWRGWSKYADLPRPPVKSVGVLSARSEDGQSWTLQFQATTNRIAPALEFHAALLGCDLISQVKAGENRGSRLAHDFVVIALSKAPASQKGVDFQAMITLSSNLAAAPKRLAFVTWVTVANGFLPVQALGGWVKK